MKRPLAFAASALIATLVGSVGLAAPAVAEDVNHTPAKVTWVNSTLNVVYSWDGALLSEEDSLTVRVDGQVIDSAPGAVEERLAFTTRAASQGPADVEIIWEACGPDGQGPEDGSVCTDTTLFSKTITNRVVKAKHGQVSALTLLNKLKVAKESHASTYKRSKFKLWIDANKDGENTRAEVLVAESKKKVTENSHHTVKKGKWVSPYDGKKFTVASKLDIDHLVPLEEAWTSGAYSWSVKKRTAYANDLGYAPSLIAVSQHENRSKGDKEPGEWLPAKTSYVCSYVRNYIAVKYRWGLKVDSAEKTTLKTELAYYCTNPYVAKPGKPNITALVGTTKKASGGGGSSSGGMHYAQGVHPGAFCSPDGAYGYTTAGTLMRCKTTATDFRDRWRRA